MSDNLILVDMQDREIGSASKETTHFEGLLHRAFSVFLYHDNLLLLQKRNIHKYHSGGLLANSCCSHPRVGESFAEAIHRRLKEELGISEPIELNAIGSILYREKFANGVTEFERDTIFVGEYNGEISICPDEIESIEWVDIFSLQKDILVNPDNYACWFIIALPMVLKFIEIHRGNVNYLNSSI